MTIMEYVKFFKKILLFIILFDIHKELILENAFSVDLYIIKQNYRPNFILIASAVLPHTNTFLSLILLKFIMS